MVAELLGYPQVNVVTHLEVGEGKLPRIRGVEGAKRYRGVLPAVVTAQRD